jgi:hypothetical protein
VSGTGFGPNLGIEVGGISCELDWSGSQPKLKLPTTLPTPATYPVVAINPEGCRSLEDATVLIKPPGAPTPGCGLIGIEGMGAFAALTAWRRRRARASGRVAS